LRASKLTEDFLDIAGNWFHIDVEFNDCDSQSTSREVRMCWCVFCRNRFLVWRKRRTKTATKTPHNFFVTGRLLSG
jgi:hypothetical protein